MNRKEFLTKWAILTALLVLAYFAHYSAPELPTFEFSKQKKAEELARKLMADTVPLYRIPADPAIEQRAQEIMATEYWKEAREEQRRKWKAYKGTLFLPD